MTSQSETVQSKWAEFYKGREGPDYRKYCEERYKPFLALIAARMSMMDPDAMSLELGAGTGVISAIIGRVFPRAALVVADNDFAMIQMAAQRLAAEGLHEQVSMFEADILDPTVKPDGWHPTVVHSHGVLEHFTDEEARGVIDRHRDFYQVHYIPGLYPEPSFGDERLLPLDHWVKALKPSRAFTFNAGLDYALVFHPRGYH